MEEQLDLEDYLEARKRTDEFINKRKERRSEMVGNKREYPKTENDPMNNPANTAKDNVGKVASPEPSPVPNPKSSKEALPGDEMARGKEQLENPDEGAEIEGEAGAESVADREQDLPSGTQAEMAAGKSTLEKLDEHKKSMDTKKE